MLGIRCVGVGVGESQSEDPFVLARNLHKGFAHEISQETGRGGGKERSQENSRREQGSRQNMAVDRREQSTEVRGNRLLGCVDP